jgi:hypothetical protein
MLSVEPGSTHNRFRQRRFRLVKRAIDHVIATKGACRILDLGGTAGYWQTFGAGVDWDRTSVSLLNLEFSPTSHSNMTAIVGDARDVSQFGDHSFDIAFSNSVIEHVGRWSDMVKMASEVRRLAPIYFVQTPYFWFPIEPHARFPFLHWMPESWRYRIVMRRSWGFWAKQPSVGAATERIQRAVLLDRNQMRFLFPDAQILSEAFLGLTKSLTAVRWT